MRSRVARTIRDGILALRGVSEGSSRVGDPGNTAFFVDGKEFAHFHSERLLDLRVPRAEQRRWRVDARAVFRPRPSEWMEFRIESADDVEAALELARVACEARRRR